MEEQTLELQIQATAQHAKSSVDTLIKSLVNTENTLTNIYLELGSIEKKNDSSLGKINSTLNKISSSKAVKEIGKLDDKIKNTTSSSNKLASSLKSAFTFVGVKKLTQTGLSWMNEGIDYTEQLNLFNVVFDNVEKNGKTMFSNLGKEAINFQYKMNEAFGTNKTQTLYMHGIFQSMGETVGIPEQYASIMSETSTKLAYDLASLFNKGESQTAEALRAGIYAGQTKPLRSYGIDVTQMSMQPILDSLGIDRQVKEMSQAEKEILRYLATLKQAQIAMGDLANTIESPSNQIKVFRQQLVETKTAISALFIGTFSSILPYANAFLMVIKEISKAIADMFGIELKDYNSGIASQDGVYDGIADSADSANKKVKELKRQVFGFDQIHNIDEPKNNDGGTGDTIGGIDKRLLDAITGYDNGMDKVRMKATEIRDRIMEWLGFTKEIDPLTGEVHFKLIDTNSTMAKLIEAFKKIIKFGGKAISDVFEVIQNNFSDGIWGKAVVTTLNLIGEALKFIATHKSASKLLGDILSTLILIKSLKMIPGVSKLVDWIKKGVKATGGWLSPLKKLYKSLDDVNFQGKSFTQGISEGIKSWASNLTTLDRVKLGLDGIASAYTGMQLLKISIDDANVSGTNFLNTIGQIGGSLMLTFGGAQIGAVFGPWGLAIGSIVGSLGGLYTTITDGQERIKNAHEFTTEAYKKYKDALDDTKESARQSAETSLVQVERTQELMSELEKLIGSNGKVKKSDEERVNFILNQVNEAFGTEYKLIDGVIEKNGKQIKSYGEVKESLNKLIEKKKAEILLNAYENEYAEALKKRKELQDEINQKQKYYNSTYQNYLNALENGGKLGETTAKEFLESLDRQKKGLEGLQGQLQEYDGEILNYENLMSATLSENSEEMQNAMKNYGVTVDETIKGATITVNDFYTNNSNKELSCKIDLNTADGEAKANNYYTTYNNKSFLWGVKTNTVNDEKNINSYFNTWNNKHISFEVQSKIEKAQNTLSTFLEKWTGKKISFGVEANSGNFKMWEKAKGGAFYNNSWHDIPQYANGGAPSHGTVFVGGENGPEIAGHINGRTEILNQSQLASTMFSAIVSGMTQVMSQYGGQTSEIDVHVHTDEGTVVDRVNQKTKQTGVCPIYIPAK